MTKRILSTVLAIVMVAGMMLSAIPAISADEVPVFKTWNVGDGLLEIVKATTEAGNTYTEPGEFKFSYNYRTATYGPYYTYSTTSYSYLGGPVAVNGQDWRNRVAIANNRGTGKGKNASGAMMQLDLGVGHNTCADPYHLYSFVAPVSGIYTFAPAAIGGSDSVESSLQIFEGTAGVKWDILANGVSKANGTLSRTVGTTEPVSGDLPRITGIDLERGETISLKLQPTDTNGTNPANRVKFNFNIELNAERAPLIIDPAAGELKSTNIDVHDELARDSACAPVFGDLKVVYAPNTPVSTTDPASTFKVVTNDVAKVGANAYMTRYYSSNNNNSQADAYIDPTYGKTVRLSTYTLNLCMGLQYTAPYSGNFTFKATTNSYGKDTLSTHFVTPDKADESLPEGAFEKTYSLKKGESVIIYAGKSDGGTTDKSVAYRGFTITGVQTAIDPDIIDVHDELARDSACAPVFGDLKVVYAPNTPVSTTDPASTFKVVTNDVAKVGANSYMTRYYSSNNNNSQADAYIDPTYGKTVRLTTYTLNLCMGLQYTAPYSGNFTFKATTNSYGKDTLSTHFVTPDKADESLPEGAFEKTYSLEKGESVIIYAGKSDGGTTDKSVAYRGFTITGVQTGNFYIIDPNYVYKYAQDGNNYAQALYEKATTTYDEGVLTIAIPDISDIERDNEYPLTNNYNWAAWVELDGGYVRMDKDAESDTFTLECESAEGIYKTYVHCVDDDGTSLIKKYDTVVDNTMISMGYAVIDTIKINDEAVSGVYYVDLSETYEDLKVVISGENISEDEPGLITWGDGEEAYIEANDEYECYITAESGKTVYTVHAYGAEGEDYNGYKTFTIVGYDPTEVSSYAKVEAVTAAVENGIVSVDAIGVANGTAKYSVFTPYTSKTVVKSTPSSTLTLGNNYGFYYARAIVNNNETKTSDLARILVNNARPGGKWTLDAKANGSSAATVAGAVGTPVTFTYEASFSGDLGGDAIEYQVVKNDYDGFHVLMDWSTTTSYAFTPANPGSYEIIVLAKGSSVDSFEVNKVFTVEVPGTEFKGGLTVSTSGNTAGAPIKISADSKGEAVYYRYTASTEFGGTLISGYTLNSSVTWIPTKAGTYTIKVEALGSNSFGVHDAVATRTLVVE